MLAIYEGLNEHGELFWSVKLRVSKLWMFDEESMNFPVNDAERNRDKEITLWSNNLFIKKRISASFHINIQKKIKYWYGQLLTSCIQANVKYQWTIKQQSIWNFVRHFMV